MLLLKATLLWSMALAAAALLRQAHAADRHRLWTIGFAAMVLLPALAAALPPLDVPVPSWRYPPAREISDRDSDPPRLPHEAASATARRASAMRLPDAGTSPVSIVPAAVSGRIAWPSLRAVFLAAWAIGTGAAIAMILLSLARVSHLRRAARTSATRSGARRRRRSARNSASRVRSGSSCIPR